MKREDLKTLGLTDEQVDAVMKQHGADIQAEQARTAEIQTQLTEAQTQLRGYEGVDIEALQKQISDLQTEKSEMVFQGQLKDAITQAGGRSVKAISALMDVAALRDVTEGQAEAIAKAVADVKESNGWAFNTQETAAAGHVTTVATGDEHGTGGEADDISGVERLFMANNPGLKI